MLKKVICLAVIGLMTSAFLFANPTLQLTGEISDFVSIEFKDGDPDSISWDTATDDFSWTGSTTLVETANRNYAVSLAPQGGAPWGLADGSNRLTYTFTYGGTPFAPVMDGTNAAAVSVTPSGTPTAGTEKVFDITVTVPVETPTGTYSQTLVFTISGT